MSTTIHDRYDDIVAELAKPTEQQDLMFALGGDDYAEIARCIAAYEAWREAEREEKLRRCPMCADGCAKCKGRGWIAA